MNKIIRKVCYKETAYVDVSISPAGEIIMPTPLKAQMVVSVGMVYNTTEQPIQIAKVTQFTERKWFLVARKIWNLITRNQSTRKRIP